VAPRAKLILKIESELKLELSPEDSLLLRRHWGKALSTRQQRNLYYEDSEDSSLWARQGISLRLREEEGAWTLGVKGRGSQEGGWSHRPEWEHPVEGGLFAGLLLGGDLLREAAEELMGELPELLADSQPVLRGELVNTRRRYPLAESGAIVELDHFRLPGGEEGDELELECDDDELQCQGESELRTIFDALGVAWRPSSTSKRERFEESLRRLDE